VPPPQNLVKAVGLLQRFERSLGSSIARHPNAVVSDKNMWEEALRAVEHAMAVSGGYASDPNSKARAVKGWFFMLSFCHCQLTSVFIVDQKSCLAFLGLNANDCLYWYIYNLLPSFPLVISFFQYFRNHKMNEKCPYYIVHDPKYNAVVISCHMASHPSQLISDINGDYINILVRFFYAIFSYIQLKTFEQK
jgi:hypothetical protein